ncbi:SMC domain protein [Thiorhodococcus drewsii AZ1]|uniref:SMC domain protein n=1 Tax=Thiorhodococcus drewsii AZ1 TaxID=765913 RepID=G2E1U4_9GAMM|nr:AAA family ATPase [Thiorhodococcus drewsii]EGV31152.1 SMC domain protein [Thiorhodococcus drewsii AZ1]
MRILRIRFKNLNSLAGEWDIDLTHPSYGADGIFAITGPTGAGKTTVLDAICLALYASTPRLNRVSKGANDIMSRRTGDCFAEVTFETQSGRYRCHWSQHRARRKPDGELQNPRHELVDANSGDILESNLRGVSDRIESVTGMDFARFTRSMLLAQGAFDTFLRAAPDDRAPILEQITGTEIYSRISIRTHERTRAERARLDTLTAELAGMQPLSEEEERESRTRLSQLQDTDAELSKQLEQTRRSISWLDTIADLEHETARIPERWKDLGTREEAFAPERQRLDRANRALELAADHAGLSGLRDQLEQDRSALGEAQAQLPERERASEQAQQSLTQAESILTERQAEQTRMTPILRQARELDLRLAEKAGPIASATKRLDARQLEREALGAQQDQDMAALDTKRQALDALLARIAETQSDAALVEQLASIRGRLETLTQIRAQQATQATDLRTAQMRIAETTDLSTQATQTLQTRRQALTTLETDLDQRRRALDSLLEQRTLADWRNDRAAAQNRDRLLDALGSTATSLLDTRHAITALATRREALDREHTEVASERAAATEQSAALERERQLLETQLTLVRRIQSLEEARTQLADGEPCPLCGATHHPYAEGNIPQGDATAKALDQIRARLKDIQDRLGEFAIRQAQIAKELEGIASRDGEYRDRLPELEERIAALGSELDLDTTDLEPLIAALPEHRAKTQSDLERSTRVVTDAETLEHEIGAQSKAIDSERTQVAALEREALEARHQQSSAEQALAEVERQTEQLKSRERDAEQAALQEMDPFGITTVPTEGLDALLAQLIERRDGWQTRQQDRLDREQRILRLEGQIQQRVERIARLERESVADREQLDRLLGEHDALAEQRQTLLPDLDPDTEEVRLHETILSAQASRDAAHQTLSAAARDLDLLRSRVAALTQDIRVRAERAHISEDAFVARLLKAGFSDESDYVAARLNEEERTAIAERAEGLARERTELNAHERETTMRLTTERQRALTDRSRADLEATATRLETERNALHQEIGGLGQRLEDNAQLKTRQRERLDAMAAQRIECERWNRLHQLIGSADGKKYRNFAQGLTFDIMIGHANRQLERMNDRYLLIRNQTQPLELDVIDKDQAGEIRSTKNLSGGESFIVSLALALGLSQMASQTVRVDSLFLDEGFGTLDSEALETALETLAGLRRDGKLIGIISHVPALKERIGTQIRVTPTRGGRSRIQGPGCRDVS